MLQLKSDLFLCIPEQGWFSIFINGEGRKICFAAQDSKMTLEKSNTFVEQ